MNGVKLKLVLDLDQTLIHSVSSKYKVDTTCKCHLVEKAELKEYGMVVIERPHLTEFLDAVSQFCDLSIIFG